METNPINHNAPLQAVSEAAEGSLVSVIVPAKDEAGNIAILFEKIQRAFAKAGVAGEIVFVDDGSTDDTWPTAVEIGRDYDNIILIRHRRNQGMTEALNTGLREGSGNIMVIMCADLQSDPEEDIPLLVAPILDGRADMVCGWRQGRREGKRFMSGVYNLVTRLLFRGEVHDQNWVKAFKREVFEDVVLRSSWHRFLVPLASSQGYVVTEVKTQHHPRKYGSSKFGFARIPASFLDVLCIKFLTSFLQKPMFFFGGFGFLCAVLGILFLALGWLTDGRGFEAGFNPLVIEWLPAHTTLMMSGTVLVLLGVQLVSLGFLGELFLSLVSGKDPKAHRPGLYREIIRKNSGIEHRE